MGDAVVVNVSFMGRFFLFPSEVYPKGVIVNIEKKLFLPTLVIRLSLGKLLVNILQVVKRTNAQLIP